MNKERRDDLRSLVSGEEYITVEPEDAIELLDDCDRLESERDRLKTALIGMFRWQAEAVYQAMPDLLQKEVQAVIGDKIVEEIIYEDCRGTCPNCGFENCMTY